MADDDVPDEIIPIKTFINEDRGRYSIIRAGYRPPLDGSVDLTAKFDMWLARQILEVLVSVYPGYVWMTVADSKQGIVYFREPNLMGSTLSYVIRLAQYADLTKELIVRCGGELLERMGLPRGPADPEMVLEARKRLHTFEFGDVGKKKC